VAQRPPAGRRRVEIPAACLEPAVARRRLPGFRMPSRRATARRADGLAASLPASAGLLGGRVRPPRRPLGGGRGRRGITGAAADVRKATTAESTACAVAVEAAAKAGRRGFGRTKARRCSKVGPPAAAVIRPGGCCGRAAWQQHVRRCCRLHRRGEAQREVDGRGTAAGVGRSSGLLGPAAIAAAGAAAAARHRGREQPQLVLTRRQLLLPAYTYSAHQCFTWHCIALRCIAFMATLNRAFEVIFRAWLADAHAARLSTDTQVISNIPFMNHSRFMDGCCRGLHTPRALVSSRSLTAPPTGYHW